MLKLIPSFKTIITLGLVLGGLTTIQGEVTPPVNAPLSVPDVIFYGTARVDGAVLEAGTVEAQLPSGGTVSADIAAVAQTDYNYSLSVPLDVFDDPDTAERRINAAVPNDTLEFSVNGSGAHYRVENQIVWDFTIPSHAMGDTYILDLMVLNPEGQLLGDVNGNGYRDVSDALLILRYTEGYVPGDENYPPQKGNPYLPLCDIIPEGICTNDDALLILKCEAGQPCTPPPPERDPLNLTFGAALEFRVEMVPPAGQETYRILQVIADDVDQKLGAASIELNYNPSNLTFSNCVTDPLAVYEAGECFITSETGTVRLNGVHLQGAGPGTVLAELTVDPVGDHSLEELEKQIYLDVYGSYDVDGVEIEWTKPFRFQVFIPLVIGGE
jgi:hypothetical protein